MNSGPGSGEVEITVVWGHYFRKYGIFCERGNICEKSYKIWHNVMLYCKANFSQNIIRNQIIVSGEDVCHKRAVLLLRRRRCGRGRHAIGRARSCTIYAYFAQGTVRSLSVGGKVEQGISGATDGIEIRSDDRGKQI